MATTQLWYFAWTSSINIIPEDGNTSPSSMLHWCIFHCVHSQSRANKVKKCTVKLRLHYFSSMFWFRVWSTSRRSKTIWRVLLYRPWLFSIETKGMCSYYVTSSQLCQNICPVFIWQFVVSCSCILYNSKWWSQYCWVVTAVCIRLILSNWDLCRSSGEYDTVRISDWY